MNKMLKISLIAVLAAMPLVAGAAVTDAEPAHDANAVLATDSNQETILPGYALAQANAQKDGQVATAGYVKGAYNAAIKAVNTVASQVENINTTLEGLEGSATQDGVVATVNAASASYTPAGSVADSNLTVVNEWGTDGTDTIAISAGAFTGTPATISPQVSTYDDGED